MTTTNLQAEFRGALASAVALLPFTLSYGFIVFGGGGAATAQTGLTASVLSVVLAPLIAGLVSRGGLPAASPSASTSLILGTLVLGLIADPALAPATPAGLARLLACTGATVSAAGLLLVLLGVLRAGALVRYVPQPVLAGFMNGVALLILWSQVPVLLGVPAASWARDPLATLPLLQPPSLALALATAVLAVGVGWRFPRAPATLLALIAASAAVAVVQALAPQGSALAAGSAALSRVGSLSAGWPLPNVLAPWFEPGALAWLRPHLAALATTALLLALIGGMETVLALAAVEPQLARRVDPDRELIATGAANLVLGAFGGVFVVYLRLRAIAALNAGAAGRPAALLSSALLALLFSAGLPLLREVPLAVVAGIVVVLAWTLVDRWTRDLLAQWWRGDRAAERGWSLVIVLVVCAITLAFGFVAGVAAGTLLAMLLFVHSLNRSLLRLRYRASEIPSRRIHPTARERRLQKLRGAIEVFELEGALFFGNAHRLVLALETSSGSRGPDAATAAAAVDAAAIAANTVAPTAAGSPDVAGATTGPGTVPPQQHVIIDLRRVSTIDASGAVTLARLAERLAQRGIALHLAGVTTDNRHGRALLAQGVAVIGALWTVHPDADRAIEAAEMALLTATRVASTVLSETIAPPAVPLRQCDLFAGLAEADAQRVIDGLDKQRLKAGQQLFAEGDPGDAIYLLTEGSISIVDATRQQRYVSFSPGMCFGETALLDGLGRTGTALSDGSSTVWRLSAERLDALQAEHPEIAVQLYRNLALHLSQRLRGAAKAWRQAAG